MAYFTAVVVRTPAGWRTRDIDIDEAESLDELVELLREEASDLTALALLEHEDDWFTLVRVDGDEDPRVFVSDVESAKHSIFAGVIGDDLDDPGEPLPDDDGEPVIEEWAGEIDLLADLGVSGEQLHALVKEHDDDPGAVLGEVAEAVGFTDLLEALR